MFKSRFIVVIALFFSVFGFGAQSYPENEFLIPTQEARQHAFFEALISTYNLAGLKRWDGAQIGSTPTPIYDINGHVLFLEFPVIRKGTALGYIWVAASKVLGAPPVYLLLPGSRRYDPEAAQRQARDVIQKNYPGSTIVQSFLVCYTFPRVGIMFILRDPRGRSLTVVVDAADYALVPKADEKIEGTGYASIYSALSIEERRVRLDQYAKYTQVVKEALRKANLSEESTISEEGFKVINAQLILKILGCSTISLTLHGQETNDYCAVATGQMILEFWGYVYTQAQIAPAMGYQPGQGCSQTGQVAGYESLSHHALDATFDGTTDFTEAVSEINSHRPLKSGIPGHARACAGYCHMSIGIFGIKKLYIYDPWGQTIAGLPHEGSIYWEKWDSVTHTNWIYVRR